VQRDSWAQQFSQKHPCEDGSHEDKNNDDDGQIIPVLSRIIFETNRFLSASDAQGTSEERPTDVASNDNPGDHKEDSRRVFHITGMA
jgi:hypothetical protein